MNVELVKKIKDWALANYDKGGDTIVECYTDEEIAERFKSLAAAKRCCKAVKERETEVRSW